MKIYDRFGRIVSSIRIIVNVECNYNCIFCHSEGYYHCSKDSQQMLSVEDIQRVGLVARMFDIDSVKITGGEPLLHPSIDKVISTLNDLGFRDISLVTNGSLLEKLVERLKQSGLVRINVSLVSLRENRYDAITRTNNMLPRVLRGIKLAKEVGLKPVKINVVVLQGLNDDEIFDFIEFGRSNEVVVQFIEYHSPRVDESFKKFYKPLDELQTFLESNAEKIITTRMHNRLRYVVDGAEVELVRPMFNAAFCNGCARIRATPTGWKPCLLKDDVIIEYLSELKSGNMRELTRKFVKAIYARRPFFQRVQEYS
ncbi:MAG: GTP 3',8-cyclase MoaA [Crenarchaeota archaeon]|nr:GTP 3',8-cyclase MoaA [Thermoproteota archaeon]MCR8470456.1 GTP 3',8-cyclase MoaA [Thermoproteota archaeon]MCR8473316.1 GTP 3',8-cyclase MoaA [Thermoproteota archaeon]MCR8487077.1 GTP 3',8-cyclase MoaA [Thermoproteota archaeon]MCR8488072.1 GTP 3',8-cyclase MoaA [Thermoproteota archaeon]